MSRWVEQFKVHPVHAEYQRLHGALSDARAEDLPEAEELGRIKKIVVLLKHFFESADPEVIGTQVLDQMLGHMQNAATEVVHYNSNGNHSNLVNANSYLDAVLHQTNSTPFPSLRFTKHALGAAASAYTETMRRYGEALKSDMETIKNSTGNKYNDLDEKHRSALAAQEKLENRISGMETQLATLLSGFNTDFQNSENSRANKFETWTSQYQDKLDQKFQLAAQKFSAGEDAMGEYLDRAGKLLGVVIDTSQAGAYATYANEEKRSANSYRLSALLLMAAAALILFLPEVASAMKTVGDHSIDWQRALSRLPFSLVLFAPALYLAKESSRHRTNEVVNRRRQHILSTIGPYLALLDTQKADEIRAEVAKSIFKDSVIPLGDDRSGDTASILAQVSGLVDTILRRKAG